MTTHYSPTPWTYEYNPYTLQRGDAAAEELPAFEMFDAEQNKIFDTNEDMPCEIQEANARLAAAAPKLLAALDRGAILLADYDDRQRKASLPRCDRRHTEATPGGACDTVPVSASAILTATKSRLQVDERSRGGDRPEGAAMNFIDTMRKAMAGEITVKTWWGCNGLTGEEFRQWFGERLDAKINRQDRRQWRRLSVDYQASLIRDANRVRQITQQRVIHRQFETDIVNARLGHLPLTEEAGIDRPICSYEDPRRLCFHGCCLARPISRSASRIQLLGLPPV